MEPIMTATVSGLVKIAASLAAGPTKELLSSKTRSKKVAAASAKAARRYDIKISKRAILTWLGRVDVQEMLLIGGTSKFESALDSLSWRMPGKSPASQRRNAIDVIELILFEFQRAHSPQTSTALASAWAKEQNAVEHLETRNVVQKSAEDIIKRLDESGSFDEDILQLHPWRHSFSKDLAKSWPELREFVNALVREPDRGAALRNWAAIPPPKFENAPAAAWCWLGLLSEDYKAPDAARTFFEMGITKGATKPEYWGARAALNIDVAGESGLSRLHDDLRKLQAPHPLASSYLAIVEERYADGLAHINKWEPLEADAIAKKVLLHSACTAAQGDFNGMIAELESALESDPNACTLALRLSAALLSRGHFGSSDDSLADFIRASQIALQVRDFRRTWRGDSVAPTLEAIKASILSNDVDRAWRLTQLPPSGEALESESRDTRMRIETALLAGTMNNFELAQKLAAEIDDSHVTAYIKGWIAHSKDDSTTALSHWLVAWSEAPGDFERLRTANALASLGREMPDLSEISTRHPEAVKEIRSVHDVMSTSEEKITMLRARASESKQLANLLAEQLILLGDYHGAASVQEAAAERWNSALFMRMAASNYLRAKKFSDAERSASEAATMAGHQVVGEQSALIIRFEALEALDRHEDSLRVARRMVTLAPENNDNRWLLVQCLARTGDDPGAWAALNYLGNPIDPRDKNDALLWIHLASKYDNRSTFIQRSLHVMRQRIDDKELTGIFLGSIKFFSIKSSETPDGDIQDLDQEIQLYATDNPNSRTFQILTDNASPEDILSKLSEGMRERENDPALVSLKKNITDGIYPLGVASDISRKSYAEASIRRAAGHVFSHNIPTQANSADAIRDAIGKHVVLDTTAAVTLGLLDPDTRNQLIGAFTTLKITSHAYRDALRCQESLNLRSTLTVSWSNEHQKAIPYSISDEEAERLACHADTTVEILGLAHRKSWPTIKSLDSHDQDGVWYRTLDFALSSGTAFWCDDRCLRLLALSLGVPAFGTVDLLRAQTRSGTLNEELNQVAESVLIANYHVDLGFNPRVMRLAAQLDGWRANGAAAALSSSSLWENPREVLEFFHEGTSRNASEFPSDITNWVGFAARGLVKLAGEDERLGAKNISLLLEECMNSSWCRPDLLPFVVRGIRLVVLEYQGIVDPLGEVLTNIHQRILNKHDDLTAKDFLMFWAQHLEEADKNLAARIIVTSSRPANQ